MSTLEQVVIVVMAAVCVWIVVFLGLVTIWGLL